MHLSWWWSENTFTFGWCKTLCILQAVLLFYCGSDKQVATGGCWVKSKRLVYQKFFSLEMYIFSTKFHLGNARNEPPAITQQLVGKYTIFSSNMWLPGSHWPIPRTRTALGALGSALELLSMSVLTMLFCGSFRLSSTWVCHRVLFKGPYCLLYLLLLQHTLSTF